MDATGNSTNSQGTGGGGGSSDVLSWVALVVSLVALAGTLAQVLQQYIASAAGYSNCGESVMGKWHERKKRKFRPTELRFEVQFETPVIFVCPPSNTNAPIRNTPISFVDGTAKSLEETRVLLGPREEEAQRQSLQSRVHTADNERASWVTLLSQLQWMEKESHEWQRQHYKAGPPQALPPVNFKDHHTLAVAVQAKKRSWDTMPAGVKKPYATTTMCHLLEIAAMMGLYWKEFDRSRDKYRAEGNGYMLTGGHVADLGVMFTFQICGKSSFQENRVIPVDEVKELCFGSVSTLFQEGDKDRRRVEFPNENAKDLSFLQLGSMNEIAETMVLIDCNTDTANYFLSDKTKHSHLFPVPFELLGMLGKTLHIRNSGFRMLPNPTPYHWDKNFFNLRRLVREYLRRMKDTDVELDRVSQILQLADDAHILTRALEEDKTSRTPGYSLALLNTLHDVLNRCDTFLKTESDRDLVRMVVREHFQEVLRLLNEKRGDEGDVGSKDDQGGVNQRAKHFDELTAASPELRQEAFMDLYFFKVLPQVRTRAVVSYNRQQTVPYAPSIHSRKPSLESITEEAKAMSAPPSPSVPSPRSNSPGLLHLSHSVPTVLVQSPQHPAQNYLGVDATSRLESEASAIWCTLVLRMLCWLLLHDFHKKDVQIPKSELLGSRLPVYIA